MCVRNVSPRRCVDYIAVAYLLNAYVLYEIHWREYISTLLKNVLLCIRSRHTSFKNYSCAEPALANGSNTEKSATELMSYRAHAIMQLTMSNKQEKTRVHNWQVQTRERRKNSFTELVPFKYMRPYCHVCQSHRTIFECVYAV